jgi:hypothetical protein
MEIGLQRQSDVTGKTGFSDIPETGAAKLKQ